MMVLYVQLVLSELKNNTIPEGLDNILWSISEKIPICIITRFAKVISCILGIETLILNRHKRQTNNNTINKECIIKDLDTSNKTIVDCINSRYLLLEEEVLQNNSQVLTNLAQYIEESQFKEQVIVERKLITSIYGGGAREVSLVGGITIDWRHLQDWKFFKEKSEPFLEEMINKHIEQQTFSSTITSKPNLYVQTYSSHPFIDVYATKCDKGLAFDHIIYNILNVEKKEKNKILYLGDSENDNAAFRKSDISVGVSSDKRLNSKLDCNFLIEYKELFVFLRRLMNNGFTFSENILH
jgi:hydroxymethylpyrimidine pyrophosphatase-like HAD family hydrolase